MTTYAKLNIDAAGVMSIYTVTDAQLGTAAEDTPHSDPINNLSRLRFHTGKSGVPMWMPRIIERRTVTVTLPAVGLYTINDTNPGYQLFAHGRSGIPMVAGRITSPISVPLVGTVPLAVDPRSSPSSGDLTAAKINAGLWRFVTLGADATYVRLHERTITTFSGYSSGDAIYAQSITMEIYVFDLIMGAAPPAAGSDSDYITMTPSLIKANRGAWRSDGRYLRTAPSGSYFPMALGQTTALGVRGNYPAIRYNLDAYTIENVNATSNGYTFTFAFQKAKVE